MVHLLAPFFFKSNAAFELDTVQPEGRPPVSGKRMDYFGSILEADFQGWDKSMQYWPTDGQRPVGAAGTAGVSGAALSPGTAAKTVEKKVASAEKEPAAAGGMGQENATEEGSGSPNGPWSPGGLDLGAGPQTREQQRRGEPKLKPLKLSEPPPTQEPVSFEILGIQCTALDARKAADSNRWLLEHALVATVAPGDWQLVPREHAFKKKALTNESGDFLLMSHYERPPDFRVGPGNTPFLTFHVPGSQCNFQHLQEPARKSLQEDGLHLR